ncbi:unnamed protein product [Arctia plantaginis]|uniref:Peptidase aspartic putative domain-containing protein n=1 Tax=Arctia plantaginis TaxID=874455 RepID=A0A8S0ZS78_ARCPL|nr:unnamed protein product [Arctia plantaginis]
MSKVVRDLPNTSFQLGSWNYLEQLQLADPDFNISRRIDILFGIDDYSRIIKNVLIKEPEGAPIAQNTSLGWIVSDSYKQFMQEYLDLGHMRLVKSSLNQAYYLPHLGVLKLESETTKLRLVYNGSSKTSSGNSLNDLMYSGPILQKDLQALILVWRSYRYVITADIEKMFRQTFVRRTDQPLQTIISRNSSDRILQEYQLTTVTYGLKASNLFSDTYIKTTSTR